MTVWKIASSPDVRPVDAQAVVDQDELPFAAVVRHHQIGLRVVDGAAVGAADEALDGLEPLDQARRLESAICTPSRRPSAAKEAGRSGASAPGIEPSSITNPWRTSWVSRRSMMPVMQGPTGRQLAGLVGAEADAVDRAVAVVGEGEHVAVAGEVRAELVGERQAVLLRAQQDLGGAERAGGQRSRRRP